MNNKNYPLIILMLCLSLLIPSIVSAEQSSETDSAKSLQTANLTLDNYTKALEAISKEIPRDTFDTSAIIKKVGKDPLKLTSWVRDNTRLVPYQGMLRGAIGVLMDRYGNSLDRAVLLQTLLFEAGHNAQLARGHLSSSEANALYNAILSGDYNKQVIEPENQDTIEQIMIRYADKFGLDADELMLNHNELDLKSQRLMKNAQQRVAEQTKELLTLVGSPQSSEPDKEQHWKLEGLADHWWVQWQDKKGNWVDLDVLKPLLDTKSTVHDKPTTMTIKEIPKALVHMTNIRVVVETLESGKLSETIVLDQEIAPSKLLAFSVDSLTLTHVPSNMSNPVELLEQKDKMAYLKSKLLKTEEWLPVLTIDTGAQGKNEFVVQNRFSINGEFTKTNNFTEAFSQPAKSISKGLEQMGGFLGGLPSGIGGSEKDVVKEKPEKVITAEWIEYEIKVPGLESKHIRRQIFDLIGPHARSTQSNIPFELTDSHRFELGTALLGETRILSMANSISPAYAATLTTDALLENIKKLPTSQNLKVSSVPQLATVPGITYSLALVRDGWRKTQGTTYLDRPNIITMHQGLHIKPAGIARFKAFDIVYNHLAINTALAHDRFRLNLEQGILDTNAEALVLNDLCQSNSPKYNNCTPMDNTAEQFYNSLIHSEKWLVIKNKNDMNQLQANTNIHARIDIALNEGNLVVVPNTAEHSQTGNELSWWIINPETGATLGINSQGHGGAILEKAIDTAILLASAGLCSFAASQDDKGLTAGDVAVCALNIGPGGIMLFAAKTGHLAVRISVVIAGVGIGVWLNTDIEH